MSRDWGKYTLELLAGFILFPILIVLISVLAVFIAVPAVLSSNPVIAVIIVLAGVGLISWLVIKILRKVSELIWQR
jgi:threonine/homoserine/homoserine lactone efflux protein